MRQSSSWLRYLVAVFALLAGLMLSIRWSERGVLLEAPGAAALSASPSSSDAWDLTSMRVFNQVLLQVRSNYVDPERVDSLRMLVHAIDRVQNYEPEIVAIFDRELESRPTRVDLSVGSASQTFDLSDVTSHWQLSFKIREVFRFLQTHLDAQKTDLQEIEYAAINGMLGTLDPHSVLLSPKIFEEMQAANRGSFGGIGIVISVRDGNLTVISPMADTPAGRAGFRTGDRIVKINDESTVNMPLDEAVSRLRGPAGTDVTLQITRDGWLEPHEFVLTREIINIESVAHNYLGDGVGYIAIRNFQGNTHDDMLKALANLRTESNGQIKGLVLDLRNDPGGLLQQAIRVSDTFLSSGTIVTTVGVGSRLREQTSASAANTEPNYPIVVLINSGSASASEIVAGALKAHDRAVIVGDVSFGKGSVQNIYPFRDGSALKLTIAQYLTPGEISIQGVGVVPDIHIVPAVVTNDKIDIYSPDLVMREGGLEASLTNDNVRDASERPSATLRYWHEPEENDPSAIRDPNEFTIDFEIDFARQMLRGVGAIAERNAMLTASRTTIDRVSAEQMLLIQEQLRQRNVDWSEGPTVRQPLQVEIITDRPANRVDAGGTFHVTARVTNRGDAPLYRVRAISRSDYNLLDDHEFVFGRINPGQTREWRIKLDVPAEDPSRIDDLTLKFHADNIDLDTSASAKLRVDGMERPHWGFSWWIDDTEGGNGDGQLQVGEKVHFRMLLRNTGAGNASETLAYIRNRSEASVFLRDGRVTLESLPAGDTRLLNFSFDVQSVPEGGNIKLTAEIYDTKFREFLSEELEIPVQPAGRTLRAREGSAQITAATAPIYPSPDASTEPIAEASRNSALQVSAVTDGWYRVLWGEDRIGWLPEGAARLRDARASTSGTVRELLQFQAPIIDIEQDVLEVSGARFTLRGVVSDESQVKDYYVLVNSRVSPLRRQTSKQAYRAVGAPSATLDVTVPLQPGNNEIIIVARDDEKVSSTARLHVFRRD